MTVETRQLYLFVRQRGFFASYRDIAILRCPKLHKVVIPDPLMPSRNRSSRESELLSRLSHIPTTHSLKLQNRHTFDRQKIWPLVSWNPFNTMILDPQLLTKHSDLRFKPLDFRFIGSPRVMEKLTSADYTDAKQDKNIQNRLFQISRPLFPAFRLGGKLAFPKNSDFAVALPPLPVRRVRTIIRA